MSSFAFNSTRNSPFRRPERSPSTLRSATPTKDDSPRPTTPSRLSPSKLDTSSSPFRRSNPALSNNNNNNNDAAEPPTSPGFFRRSNPTLPTPSASPTRVPETPAATETDAKPPNPVLDNPFLRKRASFASPEPPSTSATTPTAPTTATSFLTTRPPMSRMPTNGTVTTNATTIRPSSPTTTRNPNTRPYNASTTRTTPSDPLTHLPPALLHSIRESFAVLDRRSTGTIGVDDIAAALADVGLDSPPASSFFGTASVMNLANYLHHMTALLAPLSRSDELLAAFAAFDDGDDGVVDLAELVDAVSGDVGEGRGLSRTEVERAVAGFSGRRALGGRRGVGREEVFRYREFVGSLSGGGGGKEGEGAA